MSDEKTPEAEDVEGQARRRLAETEDDVEGQRVRGKPTLGESDDDVEGQGRSKKQ